MSYFRRGMSDDEGPITSPSQVDDGVAIVPPTRVSCDALPADSPWRKPGQVCAAEPSIVADFFRGLLDKVQGLPAPTESPSTASSPTPSGPSLLALAAIGAVGYYLYKKRGV